MSRGVISLGFLSISKTIQMSDFNENPFEKETPVKPFSNGMEAEYWQNVNCHCCKKYESESKTEDKAKCRLAFHIDRGYITGTIPLYIAKAIGCDYNPLYQTCKLNNDCREKRTNDTYPF